MKIIPIGLICAMIVSFLGAAAPRALAGPVRETELLRQAYVALARADHDYKGRRVEAMKEIEAAAKLLGEDLRGEGKGHEKQGVSDEQLRTAQALLQQASGGLKGKALKRVEAAQRHLTLALKIK